MAEPTEVLKPAQELTGRIGKYEILRLLGRGAMGQVYVAHDTILERDVALKVMVAGIADDPELKLRFEREARAVAKMTHPNVVTVFDLGTHSDGSPYIAMELLKGQDLQKALRQPPPMPLERKVAIIVQVLSGLAHAHGAGIVHRDIKPANIFIQEDGSVKIMDFGVARLTTASMTGTGNIVGTADYMSPEQVQGAKVDGRSDLFSVGCMLFELLAGRRPFHADSLMAIFYKITHETPDLDLVPEGAEYDSLLPLLQKALAKTIGERYQTAQEFAKDLREWLQTNAPATAETVFQAASSDVGAPTSVGAPTEIVGSSGLIGRSTRRTTPPRPSRSGAQPRAALAARPRRAVPAPLPWVAAGVALALVVGSGYLLWNSRKATPSSAATPPAAQPPASVATPTTLPPTLPAPIAPPMTLAPPPTFAPAEGQAASAVRAARTAFERGEYDRAVEAAQQASRADPSNLAARSLLEKAVAGQKAAVRLRRAEAALAAGDLAGAESEAQAALAEAPWERGAVDLGSRIDAAKRQAERDTAAKAQQARAGRINALLLEAAGALEKKQFDAAIAAYDDLLRLDPGNVVAHTGKSNALTAKAIAEAAASARTAPAAAAASAHGFVAGRPEAKPRETAGAPVGFESSSEVVVKRASAATALPGTLLIEATPPSALPGERFSVSAFLRNEGAQPIELTALVVATTVDGKTQRGRVPPSSTTVAPRDRALVFQARDQVLKEGTVSWRIEITAFAAGGESYGNSLTWK